MPKTSVNKPAITKIDIIFLAVLPFVAAAIALIFRTNYLVTTLLFFGPGPLWFSLRRPNLIVRTSIISAILSLPVGTMILDYIAVIDQAWWSPTIFPFRLFGIIPIEDGIWGFLQGYFVISMYGYLFERKKGHVVGKNFKYLVELVIAMSVLFFGLLFVQPTLLQIPYGFAWVGIVFFLLPSIIFLIRFPKIIPKFLKMAGYFFFFHIVFEFTALELGNWVYAGFNYLGVLHLAGFLIPIEEPIIWWGLFSTAILTWYEFFDDDQR